jgi:hypothetical protein
LSDAELLKAQKAVRDKLEAETQAIEEEARQLR